MIHPLEYNHQVKITFGPPMESLRHFPERVQVGLGITLKIGPTDLVKSFGKEIVFPENFICVTPHGCVWEGIPSPVGFLSIDIDPSLIQTEHDCSDQLMFFSPDALPSIEQAVRVLTSRADPLKKDETLFELAGSVLKMDSAAESLKEDLKISGVKDLLHEEFNKPIRLDRLVQTSKMNKFTLIRKFRRRYGLTPYSYLIKLRLEASHRLLLQGLSAAETAYQLGFSDQSHFGRLFKRFYGLTPKTFLDKIKHP
ncbi:MAG: AraC family transcriptional regulator [Leptospirales bacterium]